MTATPAVDDLGLSGSVAGLVDGGYVTASQLGAVINVVKAA